MVPEGLALATAAGVDPRAVREALLGGFAASRILEVHGRRMLDRDFVPGFRACLHLKDARIVEALAAELGVEAPAAALARERLQSLVETGGGELDHAALFLLIQDGGPAARRSSATQGSLPAEPQGPAAAPDAVGDRPGGRLSKPD